MKIDTNIVRFILALQKTNRVKPNLINLYTRNPDFCCVDTCSQANKFLMSNNDLSNNDHVAHISDNDWNDAESIIDKSIEFGINIIPISSSFYPRLLKHIPDAPSVVHVKGNHKIFKSVNIVSVVGARDPTPTGLTIAKRITKYFIENKWSVLSGLALGIDASVHEACLDHDGSTIAVLAHGLHIVMPKANELLANRILEKNGAWISEYPIDTEPRKKYFIDRNRIQAGICAGSVIVECNEKSGTATQVKFGNEQDRKIFAVLPNDKHSNIKLNISGAVALVKDGKAIPLASKEEYFYMIESLKERVAHFEDIERSNINE